MVARRSILGIVLTSVGALMVVPVASIGIPEHWDVSWDMPPSSKLASVCWLSPGSQEWNRHIPAAIRPADSQPGHLALALSILRKYAPTLTFSEVKGLGRRVPFAASALTLQAWPWLACRYWRAFPHIKRLGRLGKQFITSCILVFVGSLGLFRQYSPYAGPLSPPRPKGYTGSPVKRRHIAFSACRSPGILMVPARIVPHGPCRYGQSSTISNIWDNSRF